MTYDLREEKWIPFRRRSGVVEWGPPWLLTDRLADDPVVSIAAPRADFEGALLEILIGLLTVAIYPADEVEWRRHWDAAPPPARLREYLMNLPRAFELLGDGPRFMQDFNPEELTGPPLPIERMLIDAPGEQTLEKNTDIFVKRAGVTAIGPAAAAMALLTLQTYAPSGGRGFRTSVRGGGPLTTIIESDSPESSSEPQALWSTIWLNVLPEAYWELYEAGSTANGSSVFPWIGRTRSSDAASAGAPTTPNDVSALQCFFGLPRRIRLMDVDREVTCDLTGVRSARAISSFTQRAYGTNYLGWRHPLTPHYLDAKESAWRPIHGQPAGILWRDWASVALMSIPAANKEPARVVSWIAGRRRDVVGRQWLRLRAFGFDLENAKARSWIDVRLPALLGSEDQVKAVRDLCERVSTATEHCTRELLGALKRSLFDSTDEMPGDWATARTALWHATEAPFFSTVRSFVAGGSGEDDADTLCADFRAVLERAVLEVFDAWCPLETATPRKMRSLVTARYNLSQTMRGRSKSGKKLFELLRLPPPESLTTLPRRKGASARGITA